MTATQVGLLDSVAWRDGDLVRLVLHLPDLEIDPSRPAEVRLRDGDRRVRRPATVSAAAQGVMVEVETPGGRLADGLWRIAVRADDAETFTRAQARLLVRPGLPVALLPGPEPDTRLPEPVPAVMASAQPKRLVPVVVALARRVVRGVRRRVTTNRR